MKSLIALQNQVFSCKFWEISKKTFLYRTPLMAACLLSGQRIDIVDSSELTAAKFLIYLFI